MSSASIGALCQSLGLMEEPLKPLSCIASPDLGCELHTIVGRKRPSAASQVQPEKPRSVLRNSILRIDQCLQAAKARSLSGASVNRVVARKFILND
eukprot:3110462-Amphidinium_carterae.1